LEGPKGGKERRVKESKKKKERVLCKSHKRRGWEIKSQENTVKRKKTKVRLLPAPGGEEGVPRDRKEGTFWTQ